MKFRTLLRTTCVALALGFSTYAAYAVNTVARTVIYFDENNVIIGQSLLSCDDLGQHRGTTGSAKRITITYSCGYPTADTFGQALTIVYSNVSTGMQAQFCDTYANGNCQVGPEWLLDEYLSAPIMGGFN